MWVALQKDYQILMMAIHSSRAYAAKVWVFSLDVQRLKEERVEMEYWQLKEFQEEVREWERE